MLAPAIGSFGCLVVAWLADRRRRIYADLETIPAAAVYAGRNEVKGRAWHPSPTRSHHTGTPCIRWTYELDEERKHTRKTKNGTQTYYRWHTIDEHGRARDSFDLVDESGSVRIVPRRASVSERRLHYEEFEVEDERGFFDKLFSFGPNRTGKYRHVERGIAVGDELYVVGEASLRDEPVEPQIDHGSPFVISTRSEDSHRSWIGFATAALTIAGLGLSAYAHLLVLVLALVAVVAVTLVSLYNRITHQVQQAARAWSLIDVQLSRRHDLIPRLAVVARAATDHERVVLESVQIMRSGLDGAEPTADTVAQADKEAREQTDRIRRLFAVIEDYPELQADETMADLRHQIADAENRIAGTREFFNDAVTLLRNQRSTFPGLLVARYANPRRFVLFGAEGFERTVPPIEWDWSAVT